MERGKWVVVGRGWVEEGRGSCRVEIYSDGRAGTTTPTRQGSKYGSLVIGDQQDR